MKPVPQSMSAADLAAWLDLVRTAIMELQEPTAPHRLYRTASTDLPPASGFAGCVVDLTDINTLAKSDGTNWRRVDTGAAL